MGDRTVDDGRHAVGDDADPLAPDTEVGPGRVRRVLSSPALAWVAPPVLCLVVFGGWFAWKQVSPLVVDVAADDISYTVPDAPQLTASTGETVYRIDPTQSAVTYAIDEEIVGQGAGTAHGSTNGIAGDLAVNTADPDASRIGPIVVNVEQLHSDNNLRDNRLRDDYLESERFPLAQLDTTALTGLPTALVEDQPTTFELEGTLSAHGQTTPATWSVEATLHDDRVTATATTTVTLSSLGIGPISLAGLVTTEDDATLTMDLVALDPSKHTIPTRISPPEGVEPSGESPSFETAVAPILSEHCASCHAPGEIGSETWELATAADASRISDGIATVTESGYMPPWPASNVGVPLAHSKALSQADIDTLVAWGRAGGVLDVEPTTPVPVAETPDAVHVRPDVSLQMPDSYAGSLQHTNDYRCFVLDPGFTDPTYITGYEVTPGVREEIHHAQLFHVDEQGLQEGVAKSGSDGKAGWTCYGGPGVSVSTSANAIGAGPGNGQPGLIGGWVPGQDPTVYPQHAGVLFEPGDALILQVHYHYTNEPTSDRSAVTLQTEPITSAVAPLRIVNPLAPVEIPCMPGDTAPLCDRDAAIADLTNQYGGTAGFVERGLLRLCGKDPMQMTSGFTGVATSTCDYRVPETGQIVNVMGHMHTLGKSFRLTLDPGQPSETVLLDIPAWNFDWQMNYALAAPVHVEAGQVIRMTCTWDRAIDPNRASRYIVFAEGTEDEMCFSTYAYIPDNP